MSVLYENYNTGDDFNIYIYGAAWRAQTFTVGGTAHSITSVKLKLWRSGTVGTFTVSIRGTTGDIPSGGDLTSGSIDGNTITTTSPGLWYEITVTQYALAASTKYAIVCRAPAATGTTYVAWRCDVTSPTYTLGNDCYSSNSGSSWTAKYDQDDMFEVWGPSLVVIPTVTTQPATNIGLD